MIARLPKAFYLLMVMALVFVLAGCELARPEGQVSDPGPVSDLPPTLAPLGAETELLGEATAIPTIINVQPTATPSTLSEDQVIEDPEVLPTSAPAVDLSAQSAASGDETAPQEESVAAADELIGPGQQQEAVAEEAAAQENIVVDAPDNDLPIGGPVAANPPTSPTGDGYSSPGYASGASYVVQPGDTLFRIAQRYGTTVEAIAYANGLTSDAIQAGQVLNISGDGGGQYVEPNFGQAPSQPYGGAPYQQPPFVPGQGGNFHTVAPGETLFAISSRYGAPLEVIAEANGLAYPYTLGIGQQLIIPAPAPYPGNFGAAPGNTPGQAPSMPGAPLHSVAPGETLFAISSRYGVPLDVIAEANGLAYPYTLSIGQQLMIPPPAPYPGNFGQGYTMPQGDSGNFGQGYAMPQGDNAPVAPGGYLHSVAPGESLFGIASQYGTTVEAIANANSISYPYEISIGQQLMIPAPGSYSGPQVPQANGYYQQPYPAQPPVEGSLPAPGNPYAPAPGNAGTHTVAPGETLFSIATIYGTNAEALAAANGLSNPNQLFVGQVLYLP